MTACIPEKALTMLADWNVIAVMGNTMPPRDPNDDDDDSDTRKVLRPYQLSIESGADFFAGARCPKNDHSRDSSDVRFSGLSGECSNEGIDALDLTPTPTVHRSIRLFRDFWR